jgi:general secretion pathway protein I
MVVSLHRVHRKSRGFTLVEAIVALAVVAMSLTAIGNLANATLRSGVYVGRHLAEVETAQMILTGLPGRGELREGVMSGAMAGHAWRLEVAPFRADSVTPVPATRWIPERLVLTVQGPDGVRLTQDMVRLVRAQAQ